LPFERSGHWASWPWRFLATVAIGLGAPWRLARMAPRGGAWGRRVAFVLLLAPCFPLVAGVACSGAVAWATMRPPEDLPSPQAGLMAATARGIVTSKPAPARSLISRLSGWLLPSCAAALATFGLLGLSLAAWCDSLRTGGGARSWWVAAYLFPATLPAGAAVGLGGVLASTALSPPAPPFAWPLGVYLVLAILMLQASALVGATFYAEVRRTRPLPSRRPLAAAVTGAIALWPIAWMQLILSTALIDTRSLQAAGLSAQIVLSGLFG
jgi:hypothetical protein